MRHLPWLQDAVSDNPDLNLTDCGKCMRETPREIRQTIGCAYEEPHPTVPVAPWQHHGYKGPDPTVCPGYTCNLPEVIEIARARRHWEKGGLASLEIFCGEEPPETVVLLVEYFDSAVGEQQRWKMTPKSKGGGAG